MKEKPLFLTLVLFLVSFPALAGVSDTLMKLSMKDRTHSGFMNHSLIVDLREGKIRREQVAQFVQDRIYILEILEEKALSQGTLDSHLKTLFYRSSHYQEDLNQLVGKWVRIEPSSAAIAYGEYLKTLSTPQAKLNLWLFLVGETFGTQTMCHNILKKFSPVGKAIMTFEGKTAREATQVFHDWIDRELSEGQLDLEKDIATAFDYFLNMFDSAAQTQPVNICKSTTTFLSKRCYSYLGY